MKDNYSLIIEKVRKIGDELPKEAGKIEKISDREKFVTIRDIEIERELSKLVSSFSSDTKVFGEELNPDKSTAENLWIIDPISNTKGFIRGWHHYVISVTHVFKGEAVFAIVYDPSVKEMFTAYKNVGAYLNSEKINASRNNDYKYVLFQPRDRDYFPQSKTNQLLTKINDLGYLRNIGSNALHYCYVACGRADIAIALNKDNFLELGGNLIVSEAGGVMTDFEENEVNLESKGIIAARKEYFAEIYKTIKEIANK